LALIKKDQKEDGEKILPSSVSKSIRKAMKAVVSKSGTGKRAQVPLYQVGGKTGTVHRIGKSGYEKSEYKALFAGVAPISDPRIAMVVVIDAPAGAEYYGGEVAAPVFSRIVSGAMRLLDVQPDHNAGDRKVVRAEELSNKESGRG